MTTTAVAVAVVAAAAIPSLQRAHLHNLPIDEHVREVPLENGRDLLEISLESPPPRVCTVHARKQ